MPNPPSTKAPAITLFRSKRSISQPNTNVPKIPPTVSSTVIRDECCSEAPMSCTSVGSQPSSR
ncbi:hypothetical protein D3C81_2329040 [compost metagenome]